MPSRVVIKGKKSHLPWGRCGLKYDLLINDYQTYFVTFREEGVDWNTRRTWIWKAADCVTFREEGVDWNRLPPRQTTRSPGSPSVRKVWIEILSCSMSSTLRLVTFREEGVDWNGGLWDAITGGGDVTFREEGVDWNVKKETCDVTSPCHLPWGRCGLKLEVSSQGMKQKRSPSVRKVWIEIHSTRHFTA